MVWECERCGLHQGSKTYASSAEAHNYATAFNRRDTDDVGRRAPFLGMFPLRIWNRLRGRKR